MNMEFFKYYYGIRQLINPQDKELSVFYAGAAADLTNVMVATNASTFYMVSRYNSCNASSFHDYLDMHWADDSKSN